MVAERGKGHAVYYGNMSDPALLSAISMAHVKLVVVTVDSPLQAVRIVSHIKNIYPSLKVLSRARDIKTKNLLMRYGASWAMPEAMEASLLIGSEALLAMNVDKTSVEELIHTLRKDDYKMLQDESDSASTS